MNINLLLPSPEFPLRTIQLILSEEENATEAEVNASVSNAGGSEWEGGSSQVQGRVLAITYVFCIFIIHLDSVARGDRSLLPQKKPRVGKAGSCRTEPSEGVEMTNLT